MTIDAQSFEEAFRSDYPKTVRLLISKGCSPEDAEDLSQSAWLRGWERRGQFRGESRICTWVAMIAINLLRNEWRKPPREYVSTDVLDLIGIQPRTDRIIEAHQILASADSGSRQILSSHYMVGGTASNRIKVFRATRKVRQQFLRRESIRGLVRSVAA